MRADSLGAVLGLVTGLALGEQLLAPGRIRRRDQRGEIDGGLLALAGVLGLDLDREGQRLVLRFTAADEDQLGEKAEQQEEQQRPDDRADIHVHLVRIHRSLPLVVSPARIIRVYFGHQ